MKALSEPATTPNSTPFAEPVDRCRRSVLGGAELARRTPIDRDTSMMITTAVPETGDAPAPDAVTVTTASTLVPPTERNSFWNVSASNLIMVPRDLSRRLSGDDIDDSNCDIVVAARSIAIVVSRRASSSGDTGSPPTNSPKSSLDSR